MPYGKPPFVEPWERENWLWINKGSKLYSIGQWQMHLLRNDWPLPLINADAAEELGIPRDFIRTEARNYIAARGLPPRNEPGGEGESSPADSDASDASQPFRGFHSPTHQQPDTASSVGSPVRGFETTLRDGRHRHHFNVPSEEESGDSIHTPGSQHSGNSAVSNLSQHSVPERIEEHDLCVHECNKKYHLLIHNA